MKREHTSGWKKERVTISADFGEGKVEHYLITGSDGRTVADVGLWSDKIEEQDANARLIATAPELLQSMQDALARGYFDPCSDDGEMETDEKDAAHAVIAKATGTTNPPASL